MVQQQRSREMRKLNHRLLLVACLAVMTTMVTQTRIINREMRNFISLNDGSSDFIYDENNPQKNDDYLLYMATHGHDANNDRGKQNQGDVHKNEHDEGNHVNKARELEAFKGSTDSKLDENQERRSTSTK